LNNHEEEELCQRWRNGSVREEENSRNVGGTGTDAVVSGKRKPAEMLVELELIQATAEMM